jgi:hypothetical protein
MGDSPVAEAILDVFAACLQMFLAGLSPEKKKRRVRRVERFTRAPAKWNRKNHHFELLSP